MDSPGANQYLENHAVPGNVPRKALQLPRRSRSAGSKRAALCKTLRCVAKEQLSNPTNGVLNLEGSARPPGEVGWKPAGDTPITGTPGCCARAANGHAAAAPPTRVMNSRFVHSITSDRFVRSLLCYFGQVRLLPRAHRRLRPPAFPTRSRPMMAANSSSDIAFNSAFNSGCTDGQSQTGRR